MNFGSTSSLSALFGGTRPRIPLRRGFGLSNRWINPSDEFANYGFILEDSNLVLDIMPFGGCPLGNPSTVTFDIDGVDDCDFVSVTGSFSNWDGWGATTDTNLQIELSQGSYEFIVLCVDTSNATWYNDIWGNSEILGAPCHAAI